jgi:serine/threonine-protein kinase
MCWLQAAGKLYRRTLRAISAADCATDAIDGAYPHYRIFWRLLPMEQTRSVRSLQVKLHRRPRSNAKASAHDRPFPWRTTRRLASGRRLALYRVAAANDLGPGCYVLKTTQPQAVDDKIAQAMLRREAAVATDASHPNLITVLADESSTPRPYLILPHLEGVSLGRLMMSRSRNMTSASALLPAAFVLMLIRQTATALAAMHAGGWLHGNVQSRHVIVSPQGQATLIDLTHARRLESSECDCGDAFLMANTNVCPTYAAPESFSSRGRLAAAADTYSLGIVLFEALAGQPPFSAPSRRQLIADHQRAAPPDLRGLRHGVSHDVAELVRRMLAKEALRRPSDEQLVRWLAELEIAELAL